MHEFEEFKKEIQQKKTSQFHIGTKSIECFSFLEMTIRANRKQIEWDKNHAPHTIYLFNLYIRSLIICCVVGKWICTVCVCVCIDSFDRSPIACVPLDTSTYSTRATVVCYFYLSD